MKTRGEEIVGVFERALGDLDALRLAHYEEAEVRGIVVELGSRVERFFKSAVWPGASGTDTLDTLINRLKSVGVDRGERQHLGVFRIRYKNAKHDPGTPVRLKQTVDITARALDACEGCCFQGPRHDIGAG